MMILRSRRANSKGKQLSSKQQPRRKLNRQRQRQSRRSLTERITKSRSKQRLSRNSLMMNKSAMKINSKTTPQLTKAKVQRSRIATTVKIPSTKRKLQNGTRRKKTPEKRPRKNLKARKESPNCQAAQALTVTMSSRVRRMPKNRRPKSIEDQREASHLAKRAGAKLKKKQTKKHLTTTPRLISSHRSPPPKRNLSSQTSHLETIPPRRSLQINRRSQRSP